MILCVAEKPSVAGDIAKILGATNRREGYYEGNGYYVSWALGHLCCLKEPDDYNKEWKKWSIASLPIVPEKYGIKLINSPASKKQFKILKELLGKSDSVINCGDAGQEGELIQRWILQMANYRKPVQRLWISSLTDESIREGFKHLKPSKDYDNLYYAGMCRACGDWLLGINATRVYTIKYGGYGTLLSLGRVQTPTLAMIVQRDSEIVNFVPHDYYLVQTTYRGVKFNLDVENKQFDNIEEANKIVSLISGQPFYIDKSQKKPQQEAPELLFDLTALQVECNKKFGFSADTTLKIAQSLYEKKVTTYPRTDSRCLTQDMYTKCPGILQSISAIIGTHPQLSSNPLLKRGKVFNDAKVSDHHAIIPTGQLPANLTDSENMVYELVCRRFAAQFFPDARYDKTEVSGHSMTYNFKTSGRVLVNPGWKVLFPKNATDEPSEDEENKELPPMVIGESGPHQPQTLRKTTQPPKPYTEGTLLKAMETCGKMVDSDELAEALKENGIGRPSTRAAIIETLHRRSYIRKAGKTLISTPSGRQLISLIKDDNLRSPALTGIWENKLRQIERGNYSAGKFMNELKAMVDGLVSTTSADNSGIKIASSGNPTKSGKYRGSKKK